MPAPVGADTVITPVGTEFVGWVVTLAVGATGPAGKAFIFTTVMAEIHPFEF